MPIEFLERCDVLEECYEFMLAYAGQGLPSGQESQAGSQIRGFLRRAAEILPDLAGSCAKAVAELRLEPAETYKNFIDVLERDAQTSLAAIELVLAQPAISSQLIDNLNASIHLRQLLTDLFLIGDVFRTRSRPAVVNAGG